jgi:hypothetical protein
MKLRITSALLAAVLIFGHTASAAKPLAAAEVKEKVKSSSASAVISEPEDDSIPQADRLAAAQLVKALRAGDRAAVAEMIKYPLQRPKPLPPIRNGKDFLAHYDEFFNSKVIGEIASGLPKLWNRSGATSIGDSGLIWIQSGQILTINSSTSANEKALQQAKKQDVAQLHASASHDDKLEFECDTEKFHIRIHALGDKVRYYSWKKGRPLSEAPELALTGEAETQGTSGGVIYTFRQGKYTYVVENLTLCESDCTPNLSVTAGGKSLLKQNCLLNEK